MRSVVGRDEIDERGCIGSHSGFGQAGQRLAAVAHICERKPVVRISSELKHHAGDVGRHAFVALLAFPERALHRTAGAVVVARAEITGEVALHVVIGPPDANHGAVFAVGATQAILDLEWAARGEGRRIRFLPTRSILGMNAFQPSVADFGITRAPRIVEPCLVEVVARTGTVGAPD